MNLPTLTCQKNPTPLKELTKEWLITNGLGSYASTTITTINTRKYHGLLVAALKPPQDRTVCLAKLDEDLLTDNHTYRLGANEFHNHLFPDGYKHIQQFTLNPYPTYHYELDNIALKKTIFLPHLKNAVVIAYHITNYKATPIKIRLYPMLSGRYYHTVTNHFDEPLNFTQENNNQTFQIRFRQPQKTITGRITEGRFIQGLNWIKQLYYRDEAARGEAAFDDLFQPGYFELLVPGGTEKKFAVTCAASLEPKGAWQILDSLGLFSQELDQLFVLEINRKLRLLTDFYRAHLQVPQSEWLNWLLFAADSFMVQTLIGQRAVIAGYPWFESWGRDSFISLPGLMLITGRFGDARDTLQGFMHYFKDGLIPNFIADKTGVPIYNTVDGTLWYVNAVLQYLKYTADYAFVYSELWQNLKLVLEYHKKGTLFGIGLDSDGLLMHGPGLTWMDASVEGKLITPRGGKAVEIQALWYNTLRTMTMLANRFAEHALAEQYDEMAKQACKSFNAKYWNPTCGCLYDVLEPEGVDASIRPNQILAIALDYTMLNEQASRSIIDVVNYKHVTPYGLRTLAIDDPKVVDKCAGDRHERDRAYHNGTVWPWLLGPYITACLKVNAYSSQERNQLLDKQLLPLLTKGIYRNGLGTLNEIYDCNPPHIPRGCIAQAWSVAEPLRAYIESFKVC
ncbi:MAG: glycogen debranching enzyme N-terminal domain-containing protein [Nitrososphaerota archaeon]|jgi:predicted glycogen debranching enzyme|nr:glycogen debranching enzyme N-terminal domain-containing protein [Nitrososphaerota archaeon]